ncbi:MAG TPA: VWA domain-containing protein [Pyrinomonadaceae bacterium]|jgi:VWFA-related protein
MKCLRVGRGSRGRSALLPALLVCLAAAAGVARAQERDEVVRVESQLVQTDVTVVDKAGRFVGGLGREQFELRVDGRPVPVAFFERVTGGLPKGEESAAPPGGGAAPRRPAAAARPQGRVVVFFLDDLHLSLDSLGRTRSALARFLEEEMAPGDVAAFFTASGQLGFLQQFTDNKAVLRAALARLRPLPDTVRDTDRPPMSEHVAVRIANGDREAASFYVEEILKGFATKAGGARGMNQQGVFEMVRGRATNIAKGMESAAAATLGSLEQLVRAAGRVEGRKLIFFISDGFYLDGKNSASGANHRLQLVTDAAARTSSVVYSIDARGLFAPFNDATGEKAHDPKGRLERAAIGEAMLSQDGLSALAGDTGGEFLKNTNYFDRWVSRVLEETSNYYRVAWRPEGEEQRAGRFRRVEISVAGRPDLTVRLHRGYVPGAARAAEEAKESKESKGSEPKAGAAKAEQKGLETDFRAALSAPVGLRDLPTALSASFVDVPGSGAVLTSSVEVAADALDYGAEGREAAAVDVVGVVLSEQGKQVTNFRTRLSVAAAAAAAATPSRGGAREGVIYNHRAPLAPGLYMVKAAARDARGGHLGSASQWIEIPDLSKGRLALSSIHLGGREVAGGATAKEAPQVQFSVDRRFARSSRLSFLAFVYNAARAGGAGGVDLSLAVRVLRDNRAVVTAPARKLAPEPGGDAARIPVNGAVSLGQLPAGRYELEISVADNAARSNVAGRVWFDVE